MDADMSTYEAALEFCKTMGISVSTETQQDILRRACDGDFSSLTRLPKAVQDFIRL